MHRGAAKQEPCFARAGGLNRCFNPFSEHSFVFFCLTSKETTAIFGVAQLNSGLFLQVARFSSCMLHVTYSWVVLALCALTSTISAKVLPKHIFPPTSLGSHVNVVIFGLAVERMGQVHRSGCSLISEKTHLNKNCLISWNRISWYFGIWIPP